MLFLRSRLLCPGQAPLPSAPLRTARLVCSWRSTGGVAPAHPTGPSQYLLHSGLASGVILEGQDTGSLSCAHVCRPRITAMAARALCFLPIPLCEDLKSLQCLEITPRTGLFLVFYHRKRCSGRPWG